MLDRGLGKRSLRAGRSVFDWVGVNVPVGARRYFRSCRYLIRGMFQPAGGMDLLPTMLRPGYSQLGFHE
jgi:hypothetical protein